MSQGQLQIPLLTGKIKAAYAPYCLSVTMNGEKEGVFPIAPSLMLFGDDFAAATSSAGTPSMS
jgi:hypothetical protein